jgi:hypothetical protein
MMTKTLDLVVEVGSSTPSAGGSVATTTWPRQKQLFQWIQRLLPGDIIGASDSYGTWYEGVVQSLPTTSMKVHFKGWSKKYDEDISETDYSTRVAPLYTKTNNWRAAMRKGSEIEYTKLLEETGSKWLPAIVMAVDDTFDTVSIKFKQKNNDVKLQTEIALDSEEVRT